MITSIPSATAASLRLFSARVLAENATASEDRVGWVSAGSGRSTSDILWSCFSILLVCTYKCIHFNVPSIEESEAKWHKWCGVPCWPSKLLWWTWFTRGCWMLAIIIAPEIGVATAMNQFLHAREPQQYDSKRRKLKAEQISGEASEISVAATMNQDLYAREANGEDMVNGSGLVVEPAQEVSRQDVEEGNVVKDHNINGHEITMTHGFFTNMGGFNLKVLSPSPRQQDKPAKPALLHVNGWKALDCILQEFPELELPAGKDIEGFSKADAFTKAFACVQSSWLIIQCISRVSVGLPISQLELATIAFVVCALVMYMLWWNKPFGVERRATITVIMDDDSRKNKLAKRLAKKFATEWAKYGQSNLITRLEDHFRKLLTLAQDGVSDGSFKFTGSLAAEVKRAIVAQDRKDHIPNINMEDIGFMVGGIGEAHRVELMEIRNALGNMIKSIFGKSSSTCPPRGPTTSLAFYISGTLFSAFHICAWNWGFPSSTVQIIWRTLAVAATSTGPLIVFCTFAASHFLSSYGDVLIIISFLGSLVYVLSRLGLIFLIFYCFSSMPVSVYQTVDWTQFLPHFS